MSEPDDDLAVSTKDALGVYDAIETAKPGEPLFPIQGGDPLGPATVLFWADEARKLARGMDDEKARDRLLRKAYSAEQVAWRMQAYQKDEQPVAGNERATYSGVASEETRLWKAGLIGGTRHLREAAFHFTEALPHLPEDQAAELAKVVDQINNVAAAYEPRRASYGAQPELPIGDPV